MSSEIPAIDRLFSPAELRAMLILSEQSAESFNAIVLAQLSQFLEEQREKISSCLVGIQDDRVQVTFGMREVAYDEDLQDATSSFELDLADKNWANVSTFLCPATSHEDLAYMHEIAMSGED